MASGDEERRTRNRIAQQNYRNRQAENKRDRQQKIKDLTNAISAQTQRQCELSSRKAALESQLWEMKLALEQISSALQAGKSGEALALLRKVAPELEAGIEWSIQPIGVR